MLLAWSPRWARGGFAFGALAALVWSCGNGSHGQPLPPGANGGASGGNGDGGTASGLVMTFAMDLHCADGVSLCAATSQPVAITLQAPRDEQVTLSLQGDYEDAALTASTVDIVAGEGQVTLETSSTAGGFTLVAREGGAGTSAAATLVVSVGSSGSAILHVVPSYAGGRDQSTQLACVITGKTCADLATPPGDGVAWKQVAAPNPIVLPVP
ncbi:MAG TPA: hypothetical protein VGI39_43520, partial [Polyangiaceae bacterium]